MSRLAIVEPMRIAAISASRGTGAANLLTRDPKEAWADTAAGTSMAFYLDLGELRTIDTVFLGYVLPPVASAQWQIFGGAVLDDQLAVSSSLLLRAPDVPGTAPPMSHALWHGDPREVRYLTIYVLQPEGAPLTAGVLVVGKAFVAGLGQEWGAGRQPVDTGVATALPSGGFAIVEGARKALFSWTFGDLSTEETDQLELIGLALGETLPALVVEDAAATPGLRSRIHYGLFKRWRAFERRNRRQTRWEIAIEQWV